MIRQNPAASYRRSINTPSKLGQQCSVLLLLISVEEEENLLLLLYADDSHLYLQR